ncbi:response regulator transcription factor [soil metagenome]|jgi:DNA-binding response OmpR family regulator|nr:response regulator transcription factor [Actinomycetota bacterium]
MGNRVLVVEDDPTVADVISRYLKRDGHDVEWVADGVTALSRARAAMPDLVVLDVMLPGLDGLEVCRRLRQAAPVPVVMLTALGEETDRVVGLELGADDYVTKPFSPRELVLRVRAILRRSSGAPIGRHGGGGVLRDGNLVIDLSAHEASLDGDPLRLTVREFDLLSFLLRHPKQVFGRRLLLEHVWGWDFGDESTVTVHVRRLREKVEQDPAQPRRIVTVWGVGYRYEMAAA